MTSQMNSSYLDNKLRSLRGGGPSLGSTMGRQASPSPVNGYATMNTMSTNMSFADGRNTFQPSFVNKDQYFPIRVTGEESTRRSPSIQTTYKAEATPVSWATPRKSFEPARVSTPGRATLASDYDSAPSNTYELKADPSIYKILGTGVPSMTQTYTPAAQTYSSQSYLPTDFMSLMSPQEESNIMNILRNEMLNFNTDELHLGSISSTQESIKSLRERLPLDRSATQRLDKTMVEQLLEEEATRKALTQKVMERESEMKRLGDDSNLLERDVRAVGLDNLGGN